MAKYYDQDSNFIYEADDVREAPGAPEIPTPETPRESSFTNRPPDEWNKGAKFIDIEPGKSGRYTEMGVGDYVEPTQPTKKETFPTKPSETSMKMMDEYGKFRDFVIKNQFDGKTPDELRKEYIKNVTKTHGSSTTDAHLFDAVKQEADRIYNRANTELQHHLSMFTEQYKENIKHQRNRQEKLEDQAKKGGLTESSVLTSLGQQFPNSSKATQAYDAYRQYIKDGYDRETAYNYTLKYMQGNYIKPNVSQPTSMPKDAKTGTYKGTRAYTIDGKTFFNVNGQRLN
jgi:hypothetical protein